jgi:hypothetical protein
VQNKEQKFIIEYNDYYLQNTARLFTTRHLAEAHVGSEEPDNILNKNTSEL